MRFVLVEPQFGGNVGSVARALDNLGFSRLVLVAPACDPLGPEARKMAVSGAPLLERAEIVPTLDAALEGTATVVGTTRRVGKHRKPHRAVADLADELVASTARAELAVVFGREDHGLSDTDLDRCTHLAYLPSADHNPSLNVAQAVALVAYELASRRAVAAPAEPAAAHESREAMYAQLEDALVSIGFLHRDTVAPMMRRIRRALGRAGLTEGEVRIFRGMARQVSWAADRAGLGRESPDAPGADRREPR